MRRHALVAVAAAVALATAAPASAHATCGYSQTCTAYGQQLPGLGSGTQVLAACAAYTPYQVQATVLSCYIRGNSGDVHYAPMSPLSQGQVAVAVHHFDGPGLTSDTYQVCVAAGYFGVAGDYHPPANTVCGFVA